MKWIDLDSESQEEFLKWLHKAEEVLIKNFNKGSVKLNAHGHNVLITDIEVKMSLIGTFNITTKDCQDICASRKLAKSVKVSLGSGRCGNCGQRVEYGFDGLTFYSLDTCELSAGIKDIVVELNIPSGKMVFANDLRKWFRVIGSFDVNSSLGIKKTTEAYAKVGMAHGFVGNTCPGILKVDDRCLTISPEPLEDFYEESTGRYITRTNSHIKSITPAGIRVGSICTDLWWYCIVDYDDFEQRFISQDGTAKDFKKFIKEKCNVVTVAPGVYTIIHHLNNVNDSDNYERKEPKHFAHIEWVCKAEELNSYDVYKNKNFTIGQAFLVAVAEYPSLHGFEKTELPKSLTMTERIAKLKEVPAERLEFAVKDFLDQTFCTTGGGIDWHENGWGSGIHIEDGVPDFELPLLTKQYQWYPANREYCALYLAAFNKEKFGDRVHLNESFLTGAYNLINCILRYGVTESEYNKSGQTEAIARECLQGLAKRYPGSVPEYCKDLLDEKV